MAREPGPLGQDILRERLGDGWVAGVVTYIFLPEYLEDRPSKRWLQCPCRGGAMIFLVIASRLFWESCFSAFPTSDSS